MRLIEALAWGDFAPWTDLIHLYIENPLSEVVNDTAGVTGTVAIEGLQTNNGLGYGRSLSEIMIVRAHAGKLLLADTLHVAYRAFYGL